MLKKLLYTLTFFYFAQFMAYADIFGEIQVIEDEQGQSYFLKEQIQTIPVKGGGIAFLYGQEKTSSISKLYSSNLRNPFFDSSERSIEDIKLHMKKYNLIWLNNVEAIYSLKKLKELKDEKLLKSVALYTVETASSYTLRALTTFIGYKIIGHCLLKDKDNNLQEEVVESNNNEQDDRKESWFSSLPSINEIKNNAIKLGVGALVSIPLNFIYQSMKSKLISKFPNLSYGLNKNINDHLTSILEDEDILLTIPLNEFLPYFSQYIANQNNQI